jgi:hypothetical protein
MKYISNRDKFRSREMVVEMKERENVARKIVVLKVTEDFFFDRGHLVV